MIEWRITCSNSKSYCIPRDTNTIDFETLYDEIILHKHTMDTPFILVNNKLLHTNVHILIVKLIPSK
jgi:hypothetical protein